MAEHTIPIGELSRRTGCNIETIRYYERIGLMPEPLRRGRYRSYGPEDVGRLAFVLRARELGFTLDEVRTLLGLAASGQASCAVARDLAEVHLKDVRTRIYNSAHDASMGLHAETGGQSRKSVFNGTALIRFEA
ncbi:MerR family transcriptional regulator [Pseudochelatococcus sp. B33]